MSSKRSSGRTRLVREQRSLIDALDASERKRLLASLMDAHPELLAETAAAADAELSAASVEDVAEDVALAVGELQVEDVWERSGAQSDGSYVEPSEAAWDVVEQAMSPFVEDLRRRLGLGRWEEATAICRGTLLGLYRVSEQFGTSEHGFLDGYGSDVIGDAAAFVVETWKGGKRARARGARRAQEWVAMQEFVSEALPDWRSFLTRMLGRAPTPRRRP